MGLDISHGIYSASYTGFHSWRQAICIAANYPPLDKMCNFGGNIPWKYFEHDPLHILLSHSDCDGEIEWKNCFGISVRLLQIYSRMPKDWNNRMGQAIKGFKEAFDKRENVKFS